MDSGSAQLARLVGRFIGNGSAAKLHLVQVLRGIRDQGWRAFLFGGTLRDLMLGGAGIIPRDIDVVVDGVSTERIAARFADHVRRRTRFGGLHLNVHGWTFDIWPLSETWAFQEGLVRPTGFSSLTRTTFLNVEGAVAELSARPGRRRRVYERGFLDSLRSRVLEINLEDNPFPALCVVRGLITAARLDFKVGPSLARYIHHHSAHLSIDELLAVQFSHYGQVRSTADELRCWMRTVHDQRRRSRRLPVRLPVPRARQLELWADSRAAR
jgi:hypothetical protein